MPVERAAFFAQYHDKKLKNVVQVGSAAFGNAATRIEAFLAAGGAYVYSTYPDIDSLFREQAAETDRRKRDAILQKTQQLMYEKAMFARSGSRFSEWGRTASRRVRSRADHGPRVFRAVRGFDAQTP